MVFNHLRKYRFDTDKLTDLLELTLLIEVLRVVGIHLVGIGRVQRIVIR